MFTDKARARFPHSEDIRDQSQGLDQIRHQDSRQCNSVPPSAYCSSSQQNKMYRPYAVLLSTHYLHIACTTLSFRLIASSWIR